MSFELHPDRPGFKVWREGHTSWPGILAVIDSVGVLDPGEVHQMKFNDAFHVDDRTCKKIAARIQKTISENKLDSLLADINPDAYSSGAIEALVTELSGLTPQEHNMRVTDKPSARHVELFAEWCGKCGGFSVE